MPLTNGGYHVNGPALIYTTIDGGATFEYLGFTDSGVDMNVQENKGEILTDLFGPMTPQDFQDFGMTARVVTPLIASDRDVLATVLDIGDRTSPGKLNTPGLVMGVNDYQIGVAIASSFEDSWYFPNCVIRPGFGTRLAVKANTFRLEFYAWPYAPPFPTTTGKDVTLWERGVI